MKVWGDCCENTRHRQQRTVRRAQRSTASMAAVGFQKRRVSTRCRRLLDRTAPAPAHSSSAGRQQKVDPEAEPPLGLLPLQILATCTVWAPLKPSAVLQTSLAWPVHSSRSLKWLQPACPATSMSCSLSINVDCHPSLAQPWSPLDSGGPAGLHAWHTVWKSVGCIARAISMCRGPWNAGELDSNSDQLLPAASADMGVLYAVCFMLQRSGAVPSLQVLMASPACGRWSCRLAKCCARRC